MAKKLQAKKLQALKDEITIYKERVAALINCKEIQCSKGNWDCGEYMRGMANGMIFAVATMQGEDPEYLDAPKARKKKRAPRNKK